MENSQEVIHLASHGKSATNAARIAFGLYLLISLFRLGCPTERAAGGSLSVNIFLRNLFEKSVSSAFVLKFAATNASGGIFMGFPSLIYTYDWVVGAFTRGLAVQQWGCLPQFFWPSLCSFIYWRNIKAGSSILEGLLKDVDVFQTAAV